MELSQAQAEAIQREPLAGGLSVGRSTYQVRDDGTGGGYLTLNGVTQAAGTWVPVNLANLPQLRYVGASGAASETLGIKAVNARTESDIAIATVVTQVPVPPVAERVGF